MVQTAPISKAITSLGDLQEKFNLTPTSDPEFFTEWFHNLPDLTDVEKATLDRLKHRFTRHHNYGKVAEGVVNLLLVSPLLELAGFYDEPFLITTEPQVEILLEDDDELLRGRIDTLVIQNRLWVLVVESKRSISFEAAIPQALTYMMANPQPSQPVYGMVTDGSLFMFIKLLAQEPPQYDFSDTFSLLLFRQNKLYDVLRVLKQIGRTISPAASKPSP
jgi:hypothetical protein